MTEEQKLKYIGLKRKYLDLNKKSILKILTKDLKIFAFI